MISFTIFPAIDLRNGKVIRLAQGDPSRQTEYGDDPAAVARRWLEEGASWLHVINLDGAFGISDSANQRALAGILAVAAEHGASVEFGGGVRDQDAVRIPCEMGVERVFLGTAAVCDPALVEWALAAYGPERVAGDIGARDGMAVVKGWQEPTPLTVLDLGRRFRRQGLAWCVLTDIRRDGLSRGLDVEGAAALQSATGLRLVASGGVSSLDDIARARAAGLAGVIVGRALYEGKISLQECLRI
jgi:phosphoribosylformimino-5-aminoimidazole carboxamide ribotide isomerase